MEEVFLVEEDLLIKMAIIEAEIWEVLILNGIEVLCKAKGFGIPGKTSVEVKGRVEETPRKLIYLI